MQRNVTTATRTARKRLIDGHRMTCPRCKLPQDILAFVPLDQIPEYEHDTVPIYKCAKCRWVFAPDPGSVRE